MVGTLGLNNQLCDRDRVGEVKQLENSPRDAVHTMKTHTGWTLRGRDAVKGFIHRLYTLHPVDVPFY